MIGLEPILPKGKQILSLPCLPIPPHRRERKYYIRIYFFVEKFLPFMNYIRHNKKTSNYIYYYYKSS